MNVLTRRILFALVAIAFAAGFTRPLWAQGAPPQSSAGQPYTIEYYYKCQWGHQQEFLDLFLKNHWPLLKKIQTTGRILSLKIESPAYHTTEDGRWDYRVTIVYKNSTLATSANPDEAAFIKELWPDQETYKKAIEGTYKDGKVELAEQPASLQQSRVLVTFLESNDINLDARGIDETHSRRTSCAAENVRRGLGTTRS